VSARSGRVPLWADLSSWPWPSTVCAIRRSGSDHHGSYCSGPVQWVAAQQLIRVPTSTLRLANWCLSASTWVWGECRGARLATPDLMLEWADPNVAEGHVRVVIL